MKRIISLILTFYSFVAMAQPNLVAKWDSVNYNGNTIRSFFNDSVITLTWPSKVFSYVRATKKAYTYTPVNKSNSGYREINTTNGYYFITQNTFKEISYDSVYFFSFKSLTTQNIGICSKGFPSIKFLYQREQSDTQYIFVNNTNNSFQVYKVFEASVIDFDFKLTYPISNEFLVNRDTLIFAAEFGLSPKYVGLQCKIGNSNRTLFKANADSFSLSSFYTLNGKVYFSVNKKYTTIGNYYESSYQEFDAVPSIFLPDLSHNQYMPDGTIRTINYSKRRVERFDSLKQNLLYYTPFPADLFWGIEERTMAIHGNIWTSVSNNYGAELCVLTNSDSFVRLDITKGMYGSYNYNEDWINDLTIPGDTAFAILRNLEVNDRFIYRITGNAVKPFEPILNIGQDSYSSRLFFKGWKSDVYWLVYDGDKKELLLYSIPYNQPEITVPATKFEFDKPTWHRQLGVGFLGDEHPQINTGGVTLLDSGEVIVSAFSIASASYWTNESYLMAYQEGYKRKLSASQYTAKFTATGLVAWITSYGNTEDFYNRNFNQVVDKNGDVFVTGQTGKKAIFGNDTIRISSGAINFILKLNGKTGEILWYKVLFSDSNPEDANVESLAIDSFNNLYIAIKYSNRGIKILNTYHTNNKVSPANALVKLNANGELIWVVNTITPFTDYFGMTRAMKVNQPLNKIILMQSMGYYNWISPCKYNNWYTFVQSIDMESGKITWTKLIGSDDLHSSTCLTMNKQGDILLGGFFRGTISLDDYKFTSKPEKDCNQNQSFFTVLNSLSGDVLFASTSESELFYPFEMKTAPNGSVWIVGAKIETNGKYYLSVIEVDEFGVKKRERNYRKPASPFNFGFFPRVDVNKNYIVLADVVSSTIDTLKYCFSYGEQLSVLKLPIDAIPLAEQIPNTRLQLTDYHIQVFPNPAKNKMIMIIENPTEVNEIELHDLTGRTFKKIPQNQSLAYQEIDISYLSAGIYFFRINGKKGIQTIKVVKSE